VRLAAVATAPALHMDGADALRSLQDAVSAPPRAHPKPLSGEAARVGVPAVTPRIASLLGWGIALALALRFFGAFQTVLLAALAAAALAGALRPLRDRAPLRPELAGVGVGLLPALLLFAVVGGLVWAAGSQIQGEVRSLPEIRTLIDQRLDAAAASIGIESAPTVDALLQRAAGWVDAANVASAVNAISGGLVALVLVGFGTIFLLSERTPVWTGRVVDTLWPRRAAAIRREAAALDEGLRHWVVGTLASMAVIGVVAAFGYWVIGLRTPLVLGLLSGVAEIVPTLGPAIAGLLALGVAATQGSGMVLAVAVLYGVLQLLESYVVVPLVMKRAVRLPALVVLLSAVFWAKIFGVAGLLLAIPLDLLVIALARVLLAEPEIAAR
jgi:predicted PurR-regulated permease PerM